MSCKRVSLAPGCLMTYDAAWLPCRLTAKEDRAGRYEGVGREGYHSLYRWYQRFEAEAFPDPAGLRPALQRWTLGAYPGVLKARTPDSHFVNQSATPLCLTPPQCAHSMHQFALLYGTRLKIWCYKVIGSL